MELTLDNLVRRTTIGLTEDTDLAAWVEAHMPGKNLFQQLGNDPTSEIELDNCPAWAVFPGAEGRDAENMNYDIGIECRLREEGYEVGENLPAAAAKVRVYRHPSKITQFAAAVRTAVDDIFRDTNAPVDSYEIGYDLFGTWPVVTALVKIKFKIPILLGSEVELPEEDE